MWKKCVNYIEFPDLTHSLRISPKVLKIFDKYEQKEENFEAGGILLGYVYKNYDEIVKVTVPTRSDSRGFFSFVRSKIAAQLRINKSWKKSRGSLIYLGEWHTHCEINPRPSAIDRNMIRKVFEETKMEINFLYLIIVGLNGTYWVGKQTMGKLIGNDKK